MKWVKRIMLIIISLGIMYTGLIFFLILSGTKDQATTTPDTVLILGAQVKGSSKENAYPSTVLKERLDAAIPYLKEHPNATAIVCGGQGSDEPDSEANVMAEYLRVHGISQKQILTEDTSTRTKENIQNAQKKQTLGNTVIVTSDFHMYRSKLLAKRLGISEISGLPSVSKSSAKFKTYVREICALGYGLLFDH
ncbi:YdcF family protein [Candidatus Enterococcus ikei]|uniref:YdcF family protein n=1 Tax=Candidatus Enterococcus ikei TaxID=2815326 RepID=A0ABS3H1D0_9ENTE|nr:YdcF family protein [Enterococcus sp. DIV0869a]MBO0440796.1 YdcF family protein [Enterococcus sp. DIV0869a]